MNSKRLFFVLTGLLLLVSGLVITAVVVGNSALQKKAIELTALKAESKSLEDQQRSLVQAKKDIERYTELEKAAKTIVPQEKDQARTVREIVKFAKDTGVSIANIAFPASTLGQTPLKTTPAAPTDGSSTQSSGSSTPATPTTTQVKTVAGIAGVYIMEINVQSDSAKSVPYSRLLDFLKKLEQNRRTSQVSSLTVTPNSDSRDKVTFSLVVNVYIKP